MCTALQLGGDVEQPWLISKYDIIHKTGNAECITMPPEEDQAMAIGNTHTHTKVGENWMCSSEDMIMDRHTDRQADRHVYHNTPLPYRGGGRVISIKRIMVKNR